MATLYVDFTNGNDSNDGTSFANRVKTITSGITAARTAPGDTIRLMKSPDPLQVQNSSGSNINATFTNKSQTITLSDGTATKNIYLDGAWTASANVTCTADTGVLKQGSNAAKQAFAAGFTTGMAAYYATGTLDCSAYTKISFWIRSSIAVASGVLRIDLCSDTAGATPVNSLAINEALAANKWKCITIDNGAALHSAVASVALYCVSDPGTVNVWIDNILACNRLTLTSLIGKSSAAVSYEWYPIQSINGTTVLTDYHPENNKGATRGYYGTTETVAVYTREPIRIAAAQTVQEAGSAGNISTYSGGWDTTNMSTQTGMTWLDAGDCSVLWSWSGKGYIATHYVGIVRVRAMDNNSAGNQFMYLAVVGTYDDQSSYDSFANTAAMTVSDTIYVIANKSGTGNNAYINASKIQKNIYVISNQVSGQGVNMNGEVYAFNINCLNNSNKGISLTQTTGTLYNVTSKDNGETGITMTGISSAQIVNLTTSGNTNQGINGAVGQGYELFVHTANIAESTAVSTSANVPTKIHISNYGGVTTDHRVFSDNATVIVSDTSTRHTAADYSWKHTPTSNYSANFPLIQKTGSTAVAGSGTVTASVWVRRSNANDTAQLICRGGQVGGLTTDQTASITAAINTWEQISVSFTPTEVGVVNFEFASYGTGGGNLWFDDFTISQA